MIRVTYKRKECELRLEGHAASDAFGHDLVCAACSTLAVAAAENLRRMERSGMLIRCRVKLESGKSVLRAYPKVGYKSIVTVVMDAFAVGFEGLAEQYGEFIKFE